MNIFEKPNYNNINSRISGIRNFQERKQKPLNPVQKTILQNRLRHGYRKHISPNFSEVRAIGQLPYAGQTLGFGNILGGGAWTLEDNFDNAGLYTQTGTLVTVDSGVADSLYFNDVQNGSDQRVSRSLGFTMSDTAWLARWTMNFGLITIPGHPYIQFTSALGAIDSTSADRVVINIGNDDSSVKQQWADGATGYAGGSANPVVTTSTQYYEQQIRLSATSLEHDVFSNIGYSSHISGSPVTDTIPSTIQNLAYFMASNFPSGSSSRHLTVTINTLKINNAVTTPP